MILYIILTHRQDFDDFTLSNLLSITTIAIRLNRYKFE